MASSNREAVQTMLTGVKELLALFFWERMIFVAGAIFSLVFLVTIGIIMLLQGHSGLSLWLPLLGSGGLFMGTGAGAMVYFGKVLEALRELAVRPGHDG